MFRFICVFMEKMRIRLTITSCFFAASLLCSALEVPAQNSNNATLEKKVDMIQSNQVRYENQVQKLQISIDNANRQINSINKENTRLSSQVDSLKSKCAELGANQTNDRQTFTGKIEATDKNVNDNKDALHNRTIWGIVATCAILALLGLLAALANSLRRRVQKGASSINEVRKAQESLQAAQIKIQEESVDLDKKMVELLDKQLASQAPLTTQKTIDKQKPDHSFALKVGDEIAKIETNLSKMDPEVKGYKQLKQALKRIKDNFNAHGYEIVDLLGQDYNEGMPFEAQFIPDDTLPEGKRLITGITRLQINYNGEMIQSAKIVVRQNI